MTNTRDTDCAGTVCNPELFVFPVVKRRPVTASFSGGDVTSDGGLLLLRQADRQLGLSKALAAGLPDPRDPDRIVHPALTLVRQRLYGLCLGYEDLNDQDHLRRDLAWQTAAEREEPLASSPTLCRWENGADRQAAWQVQELLVEQFIGSFTQAPVELVLDFDSTDDRVHGQQEGRFFHGYYGDYCFLPLYVFCGEPLLVSYLPPAIGTMRGTLGRFSSCWSGGCGGPGRGRRSWCGPTAGFAGGGCCGGAKLRAWVM